MSESLTYTRENLSQCQAGKRLYTTLTLKKMAGSYSKHRLYLTTFKISAPSGLIRPGLFSLSSLLLCHS
jgi:hypothetical protein